MSILNNLKSFIFIVGVAFLAAGCQTNSTNQSALGVYQGYPCQDNCPSFIQGWKLAQTQSYTQETQCETIDPALRLGCLSYLREYRLEQEQPAGGYVFINNKTM